MPTKAPAIVAPIWWYEGYAEVGYRAYLNDPDRRMLGRFFRYEDWAPGVFGNFFVGAHRTGPDPLDIEAWGKNIGWNDQAFGLDFAQPGQYYLTFGWDETPHNYAFDAKTTFSGIGGTVLSTPAYPAPAGAQAFVNANSNIFNLGFRRDTATAKGRWTPDDSWDITVDYTHLHREGTQPISVETTTNDGGAARRTSIQLAKPVDDTTHNADLKAEYAGSSPWGKPFNVALGYAYSKYDDQVGCGTVAGPTISHLRPAWGSELLELPEPLGGRGKLRRLPALESLWLVAGQSGAHHEPDRWRRSALQQPLHGDVPIYLDDAGRSLPAVDDQSGDNGGGLPRSSLGGDARTTLSNNVLNTQITSELVSNLRYRYYDYHSNTPEMTITGVFATGLTAVQAPVR